jgi:hypothetical protein
MTGGRSPQLRPLLKANDGSALPPESFEVVEAALFRAEQVDDHIVEVEKDPAGTGIALASPHLNAVGCQSLVNRLDHRVHLSLAEHSADHKPVGKPGNLADVDDGNILRLTLRQFVDHFVDKFIGFQRTTLPGKTSVSVSKRA